jgi:hypothetical protein
MIGKNTIPDFLNVFYFLTSELSYAIISFIIFTDGLLVNGLQRFDKQPEYTEVNPGQDALMTCKVFNKKGTCSWQKDNKVRLDVKILQILANYSKL